MRGILCLFLLFGFCLSGVVNSSLTADCFNPTGSSCDWYLKCLNKKYPCEKSGYPYGLTFAHKFCKLFNARKSLFGPDEWLWVSEVRKCLQVALVPVLRQPTKASCKDIRQTGFKSHAPCYLHPGKGVPSICKLGCDVYIKVFRVIKGSLTSWYTLKEVTKAMWYISKTCGFHCSLTGFW